MSITVTITDRDQLAGAGAAAVAYNNALPSLPDGSRPPVVSTDAYLQSIVEKACMSYRDQFAVDRVTSSDFIYRFTAAEFAAINTSTDPILQGFVAEVKAAPYVWLAAQLVIDGINYCVAGGYLTQPRADEILFYPVPEPAP